MPTNPYLTLIKFVLRKAEEAPVAERVDLYRAMAEVIGDPKQASELLSIARDLERAEERSCQLLFQFQNQQ